MWSTLQKKNDFENKKRLIEKSMNDSHQKESKTEESSMNYWRTSKKLKSFSQICNSNINRLFIIKFTTNLLLMKAMLETWKLNKQIEILRPILSNFYKLSSIILMRICLWNHMPKMWIIWFSDHFSKQKKCLQTILLISTISILTLITNYTSWSKHSFTS